MFTQEDLKQFEQKNISLQKIEQQLSNFHAGFPFIKLSSAATPEQGILVMDTEQTAVFTAVFEEKSNKYSITKMVPASGAASRMFKDLFSFMDAETDATNKEVAKFLDRIHDFAFFPLLKQMLSDDEYDIERLMAEGDYKTIIKYLLTGIGLDYAALPKGLLLFHKY